MFGGRRVRSRSQRRNRSRSARRSKNVRRSRSGSRSRSRSRSRSGSRNRARRTKRRQSRGGGEGTFATPTDVKLSLFQTNKDPEVIFEGTLVPVYKDDTNRGRYKEYEKYITEKFTGEGTLNLNIGVLSMSEIFVRVDEEPYGGAGGDKAVVTADNTGVDFLVDSFPNGKRLSVFLQEKNLLK